MTMNSICIVTDSTAQFPQPSFPGRNSVRIVPLTVEINNREYESTDEIRPNSLPHFADKSNSPRLIAPSVEKLSALFGNLTQVYNEILCVFLSAKLNDCYTNAVEASQSQRIDAIHIIDSQTTSIGLGLITQYAAEAVSRGQSLAEIDRLVRSLIPRIYASFCLPGLTYLYFNGFVDHAQALVSDMLGLYSIFTLEEGELSPVEKVRNHRQVLDYFQEFLDEFETLQHIALLQSAPSNPQDAHVLRDHVQQNFPHSPFTAHPINLPLATLLGPRSLGLFVVEGDTSRGL